MRQAIGVQNKMTNCISLDRKHVKSILRVINAQEDLLLAYRLGKRPKEKSLDHLQDKGTVVRLLREALQENKQ